LDNNGFGCYFGDGKCKILCNNECVGLAFQKQYLYLLSLHENVNSECDANENVSSFVNVNKKPKENSRCVVKIMALSFRPFLRGRIERVVKNKILPPLEFSDLEQCREYIKGKYTKKIKKDAK
jgi:hypothetical protein